MERGKHRDDFSHLPLSTAFHPETGLSTRTCEKQENVSKGSDSFTSFKSTILAGHAAVEDSESSYRTAQSESENGATSLDSGQRSEAPSTMNRAMSAQFGPQPELELSGSSVETGSSCIEQSNKVESQIRDTNHNIKREREHASSPRHNFAPASPMQPRKGGSLLRNLESALKSEKVMRRLSQEFLESPRTFTERLVTIIDESETGYSMDEFSGVNLSHMTKEFRKMCKFIQDESMPEMAPSFCVHSVAMSKHPENNYSNAINREEVAMIAEQKTPPSEGEPSSRNKTYRKTPLSIFKSTFGDKGGSVLSPDSPNSTRDFEFWEKYSKTLASSPLSPAKRKNQRLGTLRRSPSASDIAEESHNKLLLTCEEQLRSLLDCDETFDSHQGQSRDVRGIARLEPSIRPTSEDNEELQDDPYLDCPEGEVEDGDEDSLTDQFSKSLLLQREMQRRRCFDTAFLMQDIEKDAKKSNEEYPKALERNGVDPAVAFLKTINSCIKYQKCVSRLRQSSYLANRAKDGSSLDSGIDTRSISKTLRTTGEKSSQEASLKSSRTKSTQFSANLKTKSSNKKATGSVRQGTTASSVALYSKKDDKKAASTSNLCGTTANRYKRMTNATSMTSLRKSALSRTPGKLSYSSRSPVKSLTSSRPTRRDRASPTPDSEPKRPASKETRLQPQTANLDETNITLRANHPAGYESQSTRQPKSTPINTPSAERLPKMTGCTSKENRKKSPFESRGRFFVTPGRNNPVNTRRTKKTYFPTMDEDIGRENSDRIVRSLHAPGVYRWGNHKTVVSPIGMYIRGTDVNLIHNNHERKNEMMLTPTKNLAEEKLKFNLGSKSSTPLSTPRKNCQHFDEKQGEESDDNDENLRECTFALPTANYKSPMRVRTVNESPTLIRGPRTRGLLQSMENRVVIRHDGKRIDDQVPETSDTDSPHDMSVHVVKPAQKTNFLSRRIL